MNKQLMPKKNRKLNDILIVFVFSIVFFYIIISLKGLAYRINDDVQIANLISGKYLGRTSIHGVFIVLPITLILKILYTIFNRIDWYAVLLLSSEMIFYCLTMFKVITRLKNNRTKIITLLLSTILITFLFDEFLNYISFTEVSIFIMFCMLILYLLHDKNKHEKVIFFWGIVLAFSIREKACLMMLPLFIPIGFYKSYKNKEVLKDHILLGIKIATTLLIIFVSNMVINNLSGWNEYNQFNINRSRYFDYYQKYIRKLSKEDREELYKESNITNIEAELIDKCYYGLSEEIEEKIKVLVKNYELHYKKDKIYEIKDTLEVLWEEYKVGLISILGITILNIILLIIRKEKERLILFIGLIFAFIFIVTYLVYGGRLVQGVMVPLLFSTVSILFSILFLDKEVKNNYEEACNNKIVFVLAVVLLSFISISNLIKTPKFLGDEMPIKGEERLYQYFREHKENFYLQDIHIMSGGERRISIITDNSEHNYMSFGGWIAFSPTYYEKLAKMNVKNLKDLCLKDNVYLAMWEKRNPERFNVWGENKYLKQVDEVNVDYIKYGIYKVMDKDE